MPTAGKHVLTGAELFAVKAGGKFGLYTTNSDCSECGCDDPVPSTCDVCLTGLDGAPVMIELIGAAYSLGGLPCFPGNTADLDDIYNTTLTENSTIYEFTLDRTAFPEWYCYTAIVLSCRVISHTLEGTILCQGNDIIVSVQLYAWSGEQYFETNDQCEAPPDPETYDYFDEGPTLVAAWRYWGAYTGCGSYTLPFGSGFGTLSGSTAQVTW